MAAIGVSDSPADPGNRLARAVLALRGVALGDSFGEKFFKVPAQARALIAARELPPAPWPFTDDTQMALSVVEILRRFGGIDTDALARSFAQHYDVERGYGPNTHGCLRRIAAGEHWSRVAPSLCGGEGSMGNGAAMRVAPVGAYFADDLAEVAEHAARSARVTHAHSDGIAGAVAVAVACAVRWGWRDRQIRSPQEFIAEIRPHVPPGATADKLGKAENLPPTASVLLAASVLGTGFHLSSPDTVPFAIWVAGRSPDDLANALWLSVSVGGDCDTIAAMVGGILTPALGLSAMPAEWLARAEPLPNWPFSPD